jgi:NAD(P)-dependent dehydrogenase (short-subunit alcohol dehydrogenase family)
MIEMHSKLKSVLITGGTSGLGFELVKLFLKNGYNVIAFGRQLIRIPGLENRFKLIQVDFNDMNKIYSAVDELLQSVSLNLVINNAGVLSPPDYPSSVNGFEYTFQVNFLSHLLINEAILRRANGREAIKIAAVTSPVYRLAEKELALPPLPENYRAISAYTSSKLYLTLMSEFLPARFPELNLYCFSFDPGTFSSGIYRMQKSWFRGLYQIAAPFMRNPGKVAEVLFRLMEEEGLKNGMIYDFRRGIKLIPEIDQKEKDAFRIASYNLIAPYLKHVD